MSKNKNLVHGIEGVSKYFGITFGRARYLIEHDCLPKPTIELPDISGRTRKAWAKKDLEPYKEFSKLTVYQIIKVAVEYKQKYEAMENKNKKHLSFLLKV